MALWMKQSHTRLMGNTQLSHHFIRVQASTFYGLHYTTYSNRDHAVPSDQQLRLLGYDIKHGSLDGRFEPAYRRPSCLAGLSALKPGIIVAVISVV